nr:MAG TPA: PORTAL PROTEIN, 15 PROTEIN, HEAD PROTEIN, TAILED BACTERIOPHAGE, SIPHOVIRIDAE.6A [Caudoviricetes sp.]
MPVLANDNSQKPIVEARSSDKVMYYYKNPKEPLGNPCHVLGTQGATSGTNTATLGSTPTKQFNIKDTGSKNQQRVVNVVMTKGDGFKTDVARDLYVIWDKGWTMPLWRVDWNTLRKNADGKWVVDAEYALVKISALPETEALNTAIAQNVTFEVTGKTRRYDDNDNPFTLSAEDFDEGMFTSVAKYYNFTRPSQIGAGENGGLVSTATDDSKAGDASGTVPMDQKFTAGSDTASSNQ